jgi:arabinoxylan arabinofuranohydrolase
MRRLSRRRTTGLAMFVVGLIGVVVAGLNSPVAIADSSSGSLSGITGNASDPFVTRCTSNGVSGYCMYTSQDMNVNPPPGNPYPMQNTRGFFSTNGQTWTDKGVMWNETQYPWHETDAFHLWAPAMAQWGSTYYLYAPDVIGPFPDGYHTNSEVGIASSSSPFGPFTNYGIVHFALAQSLRYASDPEVFADTNGAHYMLYANGDNCSDLSIVGLTTPDTIIGAPQEVIVNGSNVLGNCNGTGHPYMEGGSLFNFSQSAPDLTGLPGPYTLVFAATPTSTPNACTGDKGQPNSNNEVIAYATASSPLGPFTYQGIIMCGNANEFTDQATITEMTTNTGAKRMVIIFHDGPAGAIHHRQLQAECLWYGDGAFATVFRTPTGFQQCMAGADTGAVALSPVTTNAQRNQIQGPIVSASNGGNGNLMTNRWAVGSQEKFNLTFNGSFMTLTARINGKYVTAESAGTGPLVTNRPGPPAQPGAWEKFTFLGGPGSQEIALNAVNGKWVAPSGDTLRAMSSQFVNYSVLHL